MVTLDLLYALVSKARVEPSIRASDEMYLVAADLCSELGWHDDALMFSFWGSGEITPMTDELRAARDRTLVYCREEWEWPCRSDTPTRVTSADRPIPDTGNNPYYYGKELTDA